MDITKTLSGIHLNATLSLPLYLQIATALTGKIQDCTLPTGTKLPPERNFPVCLASAEQP